MFNFRFYYSHYYLIGLPSQHCTLSCTAGTHSVWTLPPRPRLDFLQSQIVRASKMLITKAQRYMIINATVLRSLTESILSKSNLNSYHWKGKRFNHVQRRSAGVAQDGEYDSFRSDAETFNRFWRNFGNFCINSVLLFCQMSCFSILFICLSTHNNTFSVEAAVIHGKNDLFFTH